MNYQNHANSNKYAVYDAKLVYIFSTVALLDSRYWLKWLDLYTWICLFVLCNSVEANEHCIHVVFNSTSRIKLLLSTGAESHRENDQKLTHIHSLYDDKRKRVQVLSIISKVNIG